MKVILKFKINLFLISTYFVKLKYQKKSHVPRHEISASNESIFKFLLTKNGIKIIKLKVLNKDE